MSLLCAQFIQKMNALQLSQCLDIFCKLVFDVMENVSFDKLTGGKRVLILRNSKKIFLLLGGSLFGWLYNLIFKNL